VILISLVAIATIAYLMERYMLGSLSVISTLSFIIISIHESNGIFMRANLYTMVWVGQLLAYVIYRKEDILLRYYRHQYVVQLIAATYTLAAISKFHRSGLHWANDGSQYLAIQGFKGYAYSYFDTLNEKELKKGVSIAHFMLQHKQLIYTLLMGALLLELFAFIACINKHIDLMY